jgi:hypothetical protein
MSLDREHRFGHDDTPIAMSTGTDISIRSGANYWWIRLLKGKGAFPALCNETAPCLKARK